MEHLKLTEAQKLILATVQLRGDATLSELERSTGLKAHVIQHFMARSRREGIIRPWIMLNLLRLGFQEVKIYFSFSSRSQGLREKLRKYLKGHSRVTWFAELGGTYQFGVTVCVEQAQGAARFLEEIIKIFGKVILKKTIAHQLEFHLLGKRYLAASKPKVVGRPVSVIGGPAVEIDSVDRKILSALYRLGFHSNYDISRATGIPRTTVDLRIKQLEVNGIILRKIYRIPPANYGYQNFRVLLQTQGVDPSMGAKLLSTATSNSNIVNFSVMLGSWDYELAIEAQDFREASNALESVLAAANISGAEFELMPVFEQGGSSEFLRDWGSALP